MEETYRFNKHFAQKLTQILWCVGLLEAGIMFCKYVVRGDNFQMHNSHHKMANRDINRTNICVTTQGGIIIMIDDQYLSNSGPEKGSYSWTKLPNTMYKPINALLGLTSARLNRTFTSQNLLSSLWIFNLPYLPNKSSQLFSSQNL